MFFYVIFLGSRLRGNDGWEGGNDVREAGMTFRETEIAIGRRE